MLSLARCILLAACVLDTVHSLAWGAVSKQCLNSDAQAQARLANYELVAGKETLLARVPTLAPDNISPTVNSAAANDLTALSPYQLSRERLLDWQKWPFRRLTFGAASADLMGIVLTNKGGDQEPCIRLMFRLFAPRYLEDAGFSFLVSDYEAAKIRRIKVSDAFANTAVHEWSEQFYVINLTRLRSTDYWRRKYADYIGNINASKSLEAAPVYLERFLFNVLRLARYHVPQMTDVERPAFVKASFKELGAKRIDCGNQPDHPACILNTVFMQTELGAAHPLAVTDALDNSGLAFGPRQLDLGQQGNHAADFAKKYLLGPDQLSAKWDSRFFKPIEQLGVAELKQLYAEVIPQLNSALEENGGAVLSQYSDAIIAMVADNYSIDKLSLTDGAKLLATVVAADFSNKWGKSSAVSLLGKLKTNMKGQLDECGFMKNWYDVIRGDLRPGDLTDAKRRGGEIMKVFAKLHHVALCELN